MEPAGFHRTIVCIDVAALLASVVSALLPGLATGALAAHELLVAEWQALLHALSPALPPVPSLLTRGALEEGIMHLHPCAAPWQPAARLITPNAAWLPPPAMWHIAGLCAF